MKPRKFLILMGLPGSGKSTFAKEYQYQHSYVNVLNLDKERFNYYGRKRTYAEYLETALSRIPRWKTTGDYVADGLFLTTQQVIDALKKTEVIHEPLAVEIHYWNEDRETCIKNDGGRRNESSTATIENAVYEKPNLEKIKEEEIDGIVSIKLVEHYVKLKPDWFLYFNQHTPIQEDGTIRSPKWCTGGSAGNCWDDSMMSISGDNPLEFEALDDLLEIVCPSLTFLQYNKIKKTCVKTEDSNEADYYGGGCSYKNWVCDLEELYTVLEEYGYTK